MYPVGSVYISVNDTTLEEIFRGSWEQVSEGRALFGAGELNGITYTANTNVEAGLPNIKGAIGIGICASTALGYSGAFSVSTGTDLYRPDRGSKYALKGIEFDASRSNAIYGNSETVQPNAYVVYMWKRTA